MKFLNGWLDSVYHRDAHPGRVGGPLEALLGAVLHTTDTLPSAWRPMLDRVCGEAGKGDGAHFWVGRDASEGVVQTVSIARNANHAGGAHAGGFTAADGRRWAPNHVAVGIETNCAGGLSLVGGAWWQLDGGKPVGEAVPACDVIPDPARPGRGWHTLTPYQYQQIDMILTALEPMYAPMPAGFRAVSTWEVPPAYGVIAGRIVGHVSLDARDRADPWPIAMAWLRKRQAAQAASPAFAATTKT